MRERGRGGITERGEKESWNKRGTGGGGIEVRRERRGYRKWQRGERERREEKEENENGERGIRRRDTPFIEKRVEGKARLRGGYCNNDCLF